MKTCVFILMLLSVSCLKSEGKPKENIETSFHSKFGDMKIEEVCINGVVYYYFDKSITPKMVVGNMVGTPILVRCDG